MIRGYTQVQLAESFRLLEITPADLMGIRGASSLQAAQEKLQALKDRVKKRWKKLAFELHPDRTEGDKDKERLFKLLGGVVNKFVEAEVMPPPRRPLVRRVRVKQPITWTTNSSTSSTNPWGHWVPGGVVTQVWVNGRRVA